MQVAAGETFRALRSTSVVRDRFFFLVRTSAFWKPIDCAVSRLKGCREPINMHWSTVYNGRMKQMMNNRRFYARNLFQWAWEWWKFWIFLLFAIAESFKVHLKLIRQFNFTFSYFRLTNLQSNDIKSNYLGRIVCIEIGNITEKFEIKIAVYL